MPGAWAHFIFESLAYAVGFAIYRRDRRRQGDILDSTRRSSILVAAVLGAAAGSKLLSWFEDPALLMRHWTDWQFLMGGKTIVGGLLGGTIAVEWIKSRLGITRRTGDLFAIPIAAASAIGRIGCFFGGLDDHTYGVATALPWGVDFGDSVHRHPVQLYESAFLLLLCGLLHWFRRSPHREGDLYRIFLTAYLAWRLLVDFLKPEPSFAGLSTIQWACAAGLCWYARDMLQIISNRKQSLVAHG